MKTLFDMKMPKDKVAEEVERYFYYHSFRKTQLEKNLQEQLAAEKARSLKITN